VLAQNSHRNLVPPNDLAFSCEAAIAMIECSHDGARLRLLQRHVSWHARPLLPLHLHLGDVPVNVEHAHGIALFERKAETMKAWRLSVLRVFVATNALRRD
jgi:hypothetical protein